jgi:hypothetical protein
MTTVEAIINFAVYIFWSHNVINKSTERTRCWSGALDDLEVLDVIVYSQR